MSILVFIMGLFLGSFLNSFVWRYRKNILETILTDRSICPCCGHVLDTYDLIPVLSFVLLRGRCRYCCSSISWQYPFVEVFFALLSLMLYWKLGLNGYFVWYMIIAFITTVLLVVDVKDGVLPNNLIVVLLITILMGMILGKFDSVMWLNGVLGSLAGFGFFMALWLVTLGRGIGIGDIKLALVMGMLIGYPQVWYMIVIAFVMGAIYVFPLLASGRKQWKSEVAFGPFMILAFWMIFFMEYQIELLVGYYL